MAVETVNDNFLPYLFPVNQETEPNPNYRPQFSKQNFPLLSSSIPNHNNNNLIKPQNSIPSISVSDLIYDSGPEEAIAMCEEATKVARSVAAGFLLEYYNDNKPLFIPVVSEIMFAHLNRYHLISPVEEEALIKVGESITSDDDPKEKMISAIENALLLIERDTGGVRCEIALNLDGKGKDRVYVNSIRVEILANELLPSLHFQCLALSPPKVSNQDDLETKNTYESSDVSWVVWNSFKTRTRNASR